MGCICVCFVGLIVMVCCVVVCLVGFGTAFSLLLVLWVHASRLFLFVGCSCFAFGLVWLEFWLFGC